MKGDAASAKALAEEELGISEEEVATLDFEQATQQPRVKQSAGLLRFWWDVEQIQIGVSRVRQHRDGRLTGELKISTTAPGYNPHLYQAQLNFMAARSKQELAKVLNERRNDINWQAIVEELSSQTIDRSRQGEPVIEIWNTDDCQPPAYALEPMLPEDRPTVIYGPGGTGKSLLALMFASCLQLPWVDNPLGFRVRERRAVLYLDWETEDQGIRWRHTCLRRGMNIPVVKIDYRRMALPLADDLERIQQTIFENDIGFVVCDSIGAACGGDLNMAEPAIRMFTAVRQFGVTSLLLAHTAKNPATKETSIYGSGYFTFYARNVWEIKKQQEAGENQINVGLYHRKSNDSALLLPIGFRIEYGNDWIKVSKSNLATVAVLAEHLPIKLQIVNLLTSQGPMFSSDIASELNIKESVCRSRLSELLKVSKVTRKETKWAAAYQE